MRYTLRYTLRKSALHILRACGTRNMAASEEVTQLLRKCKKIVTAMDVLDEEMTMDNFNLHFYGEEVMQKKEEEKTKELENGTHWKSAAMARALPIVLIFIGYGENDLRKSRAVMAQTN